MTTMIGELMMNLCVKWWTYLWTYLWTCV